MQNTATLIGYYGGDMRHCISAWQSTNIDLEINLSSNVTERLKQLYDATVITKKKTPQELLSFLVEHGHTSPFRKGLLDFQVTADIASHIHCLKHTVGVEINSESLRYKELKDKWYIPDDWDNIPVNLTANISSFCGNLPPNSWANLLDDYTELGHILYHESIKQLTPILGRSRAKESARYFLPYAKQLDFDMQFSFQAFMHFQNLRYSEHAQKEIRNIANEMLKQVKELPGNPFKYSLEAFGY